MGGLVKAQNFILKAGGATGISLLAIILDLATRPSWCDGICKDGRSIFLVGKQQLGKSETVTKAVSIVLEQLANDKLPNGVHAISFAPKASEAIETIVGDESALEVLLDGPRGSGKT